MWTALPPEVMQRLLPPRPMTNGPSGASPPSGDWDQPIAEINEFRALTDDYDGQGSKAPIAEVLDAAIELGRDLSRQGVIPPTCVVPGVNGTVNIEWDLEQGVSVGIEVEGARTAEVFVLIPGAKRAQSWGITRGDVPATGSAAQGAAATAGNAR